MGLRRGSRLGRLTLSLVTLAVAGSLVPSRVTADVGHGNGRDGKSVARALAAVRASTARFHQVANAEAAGYGSFFVCTDEPGVGAMGQHYVNATFVGDQSIDARHPEALVYEPTAHGLRLVAVEYVALQADWDALHDSPPRLFGHQFHLISAPNRYGLPAFYELHAWIWKANPAGMFFEWNPRVHCP